MELSMQKSLIILMLICLVLASCVTDPAFTSSAYSIDTSALSKQMAPDDLPKPVEDPSIVGRYLYTFAKTHTSPFDFTIDTPDPSQQNILKNHSEMVERTCNLKSKELIFLEDGTFTYVQHYTREVIRGGVYTYDGETLKMYDEEGYPFMLHPGYAWAVKRDKKLLQFDQGTVYCYFTLIIEPTSSTQQ